MKFQIQTKITHNNLAHIVFNDNNYLSTSFYGLCSYINKDTIICIQKKEKRKKIKNVHRS